MLTFASVMAQNTIANALTIITALRQVSLRMRHSKGYKEKQNRPQNKDRFCYFLLGICSFCF